MSDQDWLGIGYPVKLPGDNAFSCRVAQRLIKGRKYLILFVRLERKVDYDVKIKVIISNGKDEKYFANYFGDGIQPADCLPVHSIYVLTIPVPADWKNLKSCSVKLERKSTFPVSEGRAP